MAKPNRAMANLAKNPYEPHIGDYNKRSEIEADVEVEKLRADGWQAKKTTSRQWRWSVGKGHKSKEYTGTVYNVWKRKKNA